MILSRRAVCPATRESSGRQRLIIVGRRAPSTSRRLTREDEDAARLMCSFVSSMASIVSGRGEQRRVAWRVQLAPRECVHGVIGSKPSRTPRRTDSLHVLGPSISLSKLMRHLMALGDRKSKTCYVLFARIHICRASATTTPAKADVGNAALRLRGKVNESLLQYLIPCERLKHSAPRSRATRTTELAFWQHSCAQSIARLSSCIVSLARARSFCRVKGGPNRK